MKQQIILLESPIGEKPLPYLLMFCVGVYWLYDGLFGHQPLGAWEGLMMTSFGIVSITAITLMFLSEKIFGVRKIVFDDEQITIKNKLFKPTMTFKWADIRHIDIKNTTVSISLSSGVNIPMKLPSFGTLKEFKVSVKWYADQKNIAVSGLS